MNIPKERIEGPGSDSKEAASRKPVEVKRDIGGALPEADAPMWVPFPWVARSVVSGAER